MNLSRSKFVTLLAPVLCTGLLMGAALLERSWPERADAEPFHKRAAAAIDAIPLQIGPWVGKNCPPEQAAIALLRPNAIRNIEFIDPRATALGRPGQRFWLSIVQCKSAGDMIGHFPPNCYPAYGDKLTYQQRRNWFVADSDAAGGHRMLIQGMEYRFDGVMNGKTYRRIVYNFMVAPKRGILPDMKMLEEAAEDYEQRYCGAAQFQVVFLSLAGGELSDAERDEVFATLMRQSAQAIDVLKSGR